MAINPLPTIGNSLKKQKSLYKVLTPSIKPPYKFLWAYGHIIYASLVGKGLKDIIVIHRCKGLCKFYESQTVVISNMPCPKVAK